VERATVAPAKDERLRQDEDLLAIQAYETATYTRKSTPAAFSRPWLTLILPRFENTTHGRTVAQRPTRCIASNEKKLKL
jgi:hypothetical protein